MDQIYELVVRFCALPNNVGERYFVMTFVQTMIALLSLISETLIDSRDLYDTNDYYVAIYRSVSELENLLREYRTYILENETVEDIEEV